MNDLVTYWLGTWQMLWYALLGGPWEIKLGAALLALFYALLHVPPVVWIVLVVNRIVSS
jgi:hypothetical protein